MADVDIVEFLRARYAERRALAEAPAVPGGWQIREAETQSSDAGEWVVFGVSDGGTIAEIVGDGWEGGGVWHQADAEFIAANNPAFVLADLDAKERRLEWHQPGTRGAFCAGCEGLWPCEDLLNDASVFAGHPDHSPLWVPGS